MASSGGLRKDSDSEKLQAAANFKLSLPTELESLASELEASAPLEINFRFSGFTVNLSHDLNSECWSVQLDEEINQQH